MNHLNHIPLLRLVLPFIGGILVTVYLKPSFFFIVIGFIVGVVLFCFLQLVKNINTNFKLRWVPGVLIYINISLAGAALTCLKFENTAEHGKLLTQEINQLLIGQVIEPIQAKTKSIKAIVKIKGIKTKNSWITAKSIVIIYLQKDSLSENLEIGDMICFAPKLKDVAPPKNPNEFDFRAYLSYHSIHQQAYLKSNQWKLLKTPQYSNLFKLANTSRKKLIKILKDKGLNGKELAVGSALILGYKDGIDPQLKRAYSSAGAIHVLAVSGLHVGVIFMIFSRLFSFFKKMKYGYILKAILLLIILWIYALLTGLSPSIMRAATMFSGIVIAKATRRNSNIFNTLAASALVLLIWNPLYIMAVGFQLSYMAVIGIVIIQPWINNWFNFKGWLLKNVWEITAVSIAAQIATFPLGLLYFHQFPNYFLLSNLIIIPLAFMILNLGIVALLLSFIPILGEYLVITLKYFIQFLNFSVSYIDQLPHALSQNIAFTTIDTWLIYLFIICVICLIAYRKFKYFMFASIFISIFFMAKILFNYNNLNQRKIIVYNIPQCSAINFIDGDDNILITEIKLIEDRRKLMFHLQNNWINNGVKNEKIILLDHLSKKYQRYNNCRLDNKNLFTKSNYFQFYDTKIAIINNNWIPKKKKLKLKVDLLILTKNCKFPIKDILSMYQPDQIIIAASNSSHISNKLYVQAEEFNIKCWTISTQGAFTLYL